MMLSCASWDQPKPWSMNDPLAAFRKSWYLGLFLLISLTLT